MMRLTSSRDHLVSILNRDHEISDILLVLGSGFWILGSVGEIDSTMKSVIVNQISNFIFFIPNFPRHHLVSLDF